MPSSLFFKQSQKSSSRKLNAVVGLKREPRLSGPGSLSSRPGFLPSRCSQDSAAQPVLGGRRLSVCAHVEGNALDHVRFLFVVDCPLLEAFVVPDADGVVVELSLSARHAEWVPVVCNKEDGVRVSIGERMVNVGGARESVGDVLSRNDMDQYDRLRRHLWDRVIRRRSDYGVVF